MFRTPCSPLGGRRYFSGFTAFSAWGGVGIAYFDKIPQSAVDC